MQLDSVNGPTLMYENLYGTDWVPTGYPLTGKVNLIKLAVNWKQSSPLALFLDFTINLRQSELNLMQIF